MTSIPVPPGCCNQVGFNPAQALCAACRGSQALALYAIRLQILHFGSCFFSSSASLHFYRCPVWEKNVTVSAIRPLLKHILEELLVSTDAECALVKEMRETIADDLQAQYINGGISELIDMCTFLDPWFRTRYLENEKETLAKVEKVLK